MFVGPLEAEFGWTRQQISVGALASTFALALASPFIGAAVDRFGVRGPGALGLLGLGLGFVALGQMGGSIGLYIGIQVLIAFIAGASSPLTFTRAVNAYFEKARGLALGLTLAGMGVTATLAPRLVTGIIESAGWRQGYLTLAIIAAAAALPVYLLFRLKPTSPGLTPLVGTSADVRAVVRSAIFWRLFATFLLLSLAVAGYVLHLIPMLVDSGMTAAEAAAVQGALGASVLAGRLVMGYLVDVFFAPKVAALMALTASCGVAALAFGGADYALLAAIALGFALGAEVDLIGYLTARYFGLATYGRIYGLLYGSFIIGAGLSPLAIATLATSSNGYSVALVGSTAMLLVVALLFARSPVFSRTD